MVEPIVYKAIASLASGQVYPDVAPAGVLAPWITYQAVGGQDFTGLDNKLPDKENARVQLSVWAKSRKEAGLLMRQIKKALVNPEVKAVPIGSPVSSFEQDTLLYGSSLDFSITYRTTD
ncbi:Protein of uncharacterised function (DUF3168) [Burkholderia pseudomallei]|uniref:DUF3168 domain-containing protein n=1 Tax=Burkholderia pseudomallei TaxID=28450 RepID=UPI00016ABD38|nr:DUF3168 domain-containing protein [Burkholderia pseudomallei]KGW49861.1 hypothetical protein Y049_532 [Burkholderia pseudomallei MSHR684]AIV78176.1 hypothetical protein X994_1408 [Burkholderia pseudomallei]AYX28483.1 DUF3168 domain-containing protein [Burkholderia pseudomallei]AYX36834.1 DUF3168 domain-containing protein [Burkholderia pseudomallei]KGC37658.1 hypothetical protein DO62_5180 [Burkholderia pseudomallei]